MSLLFGPFWDPFLYVATVARGECEGLSTALSLCGGNDGRRGVSGAGLCRVYAGRVRVRVLVRGGVGECLGHSARGCGSWDQGALGTRAMVGATMHGDTARDASRYVSQDPECRIC